MDIDLSTADSVWSQICTHWQKSLPLCGCSSIIWSDILSSHTADFTERMSPLENSSLLVWPLCEEEHSLLHADHIQSSFKMSSRTLKLIVDWLYCTHCQLLYGTNSGSSMSSISVCNEFLKPSVCNTECHYRPISSNMTFVFYYFTINDSPLNNSNVQWFLTHSFIHTARVLPDLHHICLCCRHIFATAAESI